MKLRFIVGCCLVVVALLAACTRSAEVVAPSPAAPPAETPAPPPTQTPQPSATPTVLPEGLVVQFIGNSCTLITAPDGTHILSDPYGSYSHPAGLRKLPADLQADAVTVSHSHPDHNNVKAVGGTPQVLTEPGMYQIGIVKVTGYGGFEGSPSGPSRNPHTVFVFEGAGVKIVHLGDSGPITQTDTLAAIQNADVILVNIDGYVFPAQQIMPWMQQVGARTIIPTHYSLSADAPWQGAPTIPEFLETLPAGTAVVETGSEIQVTPGMPNQVAVLTSASAMATPTPTPTPVSVDVTPQPATDAYLGQVPPGLKPIVFARGSVSIPGATDYAGSFAADGTEFYFTRGTETGQNLYETHLSDGVWSEPAPVAFSAGYNAHEPHVTFDNQTLYFGWFRPPPSEEKSTEEYGIWAVDRTAGGWSEPRYVGAGMFVSSDRSGQLYVTDLKTRRVGQVSLADGRFTDWQPISTGAHPCIAPDGSYLIYDRDGTSMYVRFRSADGTWGAAKDLTQHGLPAKAGIASISPDGKYLFFGFQGDLYWVSTELITQLKDE